MLSKWKRQAMRQQALKSASAESTVPLNNTTSSNISSLLAQSVQNSITRNNTYTPPPASTSDSEPVNETKYTDAEIEEMLDQFKSNMRSTNTGLSDTGLTTMETLGQNVNKRLTEDLKENVIQSIGPGIKKWAEESPFMNGGIFGTRRNQNKPDSVKTSDPAIDLSKYKLVGGAILLVIAGIVVIKITT